MTSHETFLIRWLFEPSHHTLVVHMICNIWYSPYHIVHIIWYILVICSCTLIFTNYSTNLGQTWNFIHDLRHICSCSNKTHVQILMNVKESRNDLMFVIIRKENWIVIEFNSDNFVTFTTRCWCHNPILIDHSSNTKIVLLNFCFQISLTINRTLGIHGPSGNDQSETVLGFFLRS